jgi:hypothetical protein
VNISPVHIDLTPTHQKIRPPEFLLGGPGVDTKKMHKDTLRQTCVYASGGICGSHNAFLCVWGMSPCYFSCSRGPGEDATKSALGDIMIDLCF